MIYMPQVESMKALELCAIGRSHVGILFGEIKAAGPVQYQFLFYVYKKIKKPEEQPLFIVSSEENMLHEEMGGATHFICVFDESGHSNMRGSDDWSERDKFLKKAIEIAEKKIGLGSSKDET